MTNDLEFWEKEIAGCKKLNNNKIKYDRQIEVKINKNVPDYLPNIAKVHNDYDKIEYSLDYNTDKKLRTGKYNIDRKIDFHGLTISEALDVFLKSIDYCYQYGYRCLLFVTGKGNNSEKGRETIKENFMKWVKLDFVSDKILKIVQATNKDGGNGAFYVLLRRNRD